MNRRLPHSNLTTFVARETDLDELRKLVSTRRLVTVTGQAGIGKSCTARRLAELLRRSFGGSVVVVEMEGREASHVNDAIADAVGSPGSSVEDIARELGEKPNLIVIDDLDDSNLAASALEQLLRHTSETRLVVTSRQRTGIRGETPYVLSPLTTPSPSALQGPSDAALESPSGTMLLQLIHEEAPGFRPTAATMEDLFSVCQATDGVPRFIEAAARAISVLGPRATAMAVTEDPTVLDSFLSPGFQTMSSKAALDGSLARVSEPAYRLLERLSLFTSGCDLRFAADVFADGRMAKIAGPISELVDQSLVRSETEDDERRLRVPLHYRSHILASWDIDSRSVQQQQLRSALLGKMRHCAASWFSEDQQRSIQFLNRHAGDVTALLGAMSAEPDDAHEALDIISALRYYWQLHPVDPWPRVRDWLGTALAIDPVQDSVTVRAMLTDAYIAYQEGDLEGAMAQLTASSSGSDQSLMGTDEALFAVFVEALIELAGGDPSAAEPKLSRVLRESMQAELREHLGEKYWFLATCQIALGREDDAMETLNEGLAYCQRVGDFWGRGYMWWLLAFIASRQGRTTEAMVHVRDSVGVMSEFGDRRGLGHCFRLFASMSDRNREDSSTPSLAESTPRRSQDGPPNPLLELTPVGHLLFASVPPTPLPDDRSLRAMLALVVDGETPSTATERSESSNPLSAREWEIAALVAEGLGNPAIAARLVLSRRTVEGHVQRILAKLGFRSRSQIAVWAAQATARTQTRP